MILERANKTDLYNSIYARMRKKNKKSRRYDDDDLYLQQMRLPVNNRY